MADLDQRPIIVRIDGVDISRIVRSVLILDDDPDVHSLDIELDPEFKSETIDALRRLEKVGSAWGGRFHVRKVGSYRRT